MNAFRLHIRLNGYDIEDAVRDNRIAIGLWRNNNIEKCMKADSEASMLKAVSKRDKSSRSAKYQAKQIWRFKGEMEPGDVVIVPEASPSDVVHVGQIPLDGNVYPTSDGLLCRRIVWLGTFSKSQASDQLSIQFRQRPTCVRLQPELLNEVLNFVDPADDDGRLPGEVRGANAYHEGNATPVLVNRYERSAKARQECIRYYGTRCTVCDLDFAERYGEHGRDFIHVHHLEQLSRSGKSRIVDPIRDLRPICPNCHAMIHRRGEMLSIDQAKKLLVRDKVQSASSGR